MEVFVIRDGQQLGPFSAEDTVAQMDEGKLSPDDWAWAAGLDEWQPLGKIFDVSNSTPPTSPQAATVSPDRNDRDDASGGVSKNERTRSLRQRVRNMRRYVDQHFTPRIVILTTALLLIATWLFPPWTHYRRHQGVRPDVPHGWFFVFDTMQKEPQYLRSEITMSIDLGRLLLIDGILIVAGGFLAYACSRRSASRPAVVRVASITVCAAPLIIIFCVGALSIARTVELKKRQYAEAGKKAANLAQEGRDAGLIKQVRKAAEQGDAYSECSLGFYYRDGSRGLPQEFSEAARWFQKAAEHGNAAAQCNIGFLYYTGQGVSQDFAEAVKWYRKAADQGDTYAQGNLGLCYYNGHGVPKDFVEAYIWLSLAVAQGNTRLRDSRDTAAVLISPERLRDAQRRASEFVPHNSDTDRVMQLYKQFGLSGGRPDSVPTPTPAPSQADTDADPTLTDEQ